MKLLLIDNRVRSIEYITRSLEEDVDFIIFDYETETVESLTSKILIKVYDSIGIVQDQDNIPSYTLAKPMGDYDLNDYSTWTTYKELIAWCVSNLGTRFWDLIECNIDETWQPVISSLQSEFNIMIRSSSKQLGNTDLGDNWVFDDGTSLIGIYFTSAINDYPHTLGLSYNNIITFIDSDAKPWVRPDANNQNATYGSLGLGNNLVNTSTNFFAIDLSNVTQVVQNDRVQVFLKSDGTCYSCGYSRPNSTGHGTAETIASFTIPQYNKPTIISFPTGTLPIKYITSSGYLSSFFLSTDSKLYVCGQNVYGELTTTNTGKLVLQKSLDNVYLVSSFFYSTLIVLTTDKTIIYLYGYNIVNSKSFMAPSPSSFTTTKEIKQIESADISLYYVDVENNLYAYGYNNVGQLGVGDTTNKTEFTKVNGPSNVLVNNVLKVSSACYTLQIITLTGDLYLCGQYPWTTTAVDFNTTFDSTIHTSTPVKCSIDKKVVDVYSIEDRYRYYLTNCYFTPTDGIYGKLTSLTTYSTLPKNGDSAPLTTTPYNPYIIILNNCIQTFLSKTGIPSTRALPGNKNVTSGILGQGNITENVSGNFVTINLSDCIQAEQVTRGQIFLKKDGSCYACGYNTKYSLGLPTIDTVYSTPTQITLSNKVKYITCGNYHTFFLMTNGDLYVCGTSGLGATTLTNTLDAGANQVTLCASNVYLVSSLRDTTLIVYADKMNSIYLYGVDGRYTDWTATSTTLGVNPTPKVIQTINSKNIKSIVCGGPTIYYIDVDNNLYGTGYNNCGQLGNGTNVTSTTWVQISGPSSVLNNNVLTISSAYVTLQIITLTGELYLCGLYPWTNATAAFTSSFDDATTSTYYVNTPTLCMSGTKVKYIFSTIISCVAQSGNNYVSCVFVDNNNEYKRLSTLTTTVSDSSIASITPITSKNQIISQQTSLSLIDSTGSIFVIGTNFYGASNVTLTNEYNKVTKSLGSTVIQVTNTSRGNLVLLQNGDVWGFGYNQYGELGTTVSADTSSPVGSGAGVKLTFGTDTIKFIASNEYHSLFITSTGLVYSCGLNNYGQLGQGNINNLTTSTLISGLSSISACYCGLYSSYFLNNTGIFYACGYNFNTELGTNFVTATVDLYYLTPVQLTGICSNVATGDNHSLTIVGGTVYSAGLNNYGQLGLGNTNVYSGYQTLTNSTFTKIFAGENRSAGITSSDSLYIWGKNIGTTPVLTDINVTTVYQMTDIGIVYIKKNKYYVAYGTDILSPYTLKAPYTTNTIPNISLSLLTIYSNICFLEGTQVKCDQGLIEIEKINPDLHTISKKKIVAITETYSNEKELVIMEKDSLRNNVPNQRTVITLEHKVFYKGKMIEASKVTKKRQKYNGELLYNVLMEEHNKMSVNNMIVETLDPSNTIGKVFKGIREYRP